MESTSLTSSIFTFLIVLFTFFLMGSRIVFAHCDTMDSHQERPASSGIRRRFIMHLFEYIKEKRVGIKQACSELFLSGSGNNKDQGAFYESKPAASQK